MSRKASDGPRLYKTSETGPLPDTQEGRDEGRPGIALNMQPAHCAETEFECDCNCGCPSYDGDPNHECDWPECRCECKVDCRGCKLVVATNGC